MGFIIGLLTLFMVLDCVVLVFLVLIQLPKKEAGAGLAFGGAASDALFGAGSGNVLTKITKYFATAFFILAVILAILQSRHYYGGPSKFQQGLMNDTGARPPAATPATPPTMPAPPASPSAVPTTPGASSSAPGQVPGTPSTAPKLLIPQPEATPAATQTPATPAPTNPAAPAAPSTAPK